jgi:hypothetical protein
VIWRRRKEGLHKGVLDRENVEWGEQYRIEKGWGLEEGKRIEKGRIEKEKAWEEGKKQGTNLFLYNEVGQFNINPRDLPDGKLVDDWFPVKNRPGKKEGVTGDIQ